MKQAIRKFFLFSAVFFFLLTIILSYLFPSQTYSPSSNRLSSFIIASEFMHNAQEAQQVFGHLQEEKTQTRIEEFRLALQGHFVLILLYVVFLSSLIFLLRYNFFDSPLKPQKQREKFWRYFIVLAFSSVITAAVCDIGENILLLQIHPQLVSWQEVNFSWLSWFAHIKWSAFAFFFFLLSLIFYWYKLRWPALFAFFIFVLNLLSYVNLALVEHQAIYMGLLWFLIWAQTLSNRFWLQT